MNEKLLKAVQEQINKELYSSYLYLSMSSWADSQDWDGIANWLYVQSKEEMAHAMILHNNLLERGERSLFSTIEQPPTDWENLEEVFEAVYTHEQYVSACINELATIAMECKDHAFYQFIQWFVKEQVEEEASASKLLARVKRLSDNMAMLENLDIELGSRIFNEPVVN